MLGAHEYRGKGLPLQIASNEFRLWTDCNAFTHILSRGAFYTWSNGRRGRDFTEKMLDRAVCNDEWLNFWSSVSCCTLTKSASDHFPILLDLKKENRAFSSSYKFMKMWSFHQDCAKIIEDAWPQSFVGCPMYVLSQKLKAMKVKLKEWNLSVFGNIQNNVVSAMKKVDEVQSLIDMNGFSDSLVDQEKDAQMELVKALHFEEEFWLQKSRMKWHLEGDRNTKFFHKMAKIKVVSKQISLLKNGDAVLSNSDELENHIVQYYAALFNEDNGCIDNGLIEDLISPEVSLEQNQALTSLP